MSLPSSEQREVAKALNEDDPVLEALAEKAAEHVYWCLNNAGWLFEATLLVEHFPERLLRRLRHGTF